MSYLVLARKWRPQSFDDVLAQGLITDTLKNSIVNGRISHSYLFSGPRGVGKTTTARILAKALNCQSYEEPTATPCNKCSSCLEITEVRSPDVLEMDGASNRSVDDIQPIRERVQFAPQNRYKVIIIDEVHMLTTHAFNALLKTLEEPPPNVVFVFATTEPEKIPATIISRCQRHDFKRVPTELIKKHLIKLAEPESIDISEDAAELIALKADGALRDGLSLFDQIIAYAQGGQIGREVAAQILGVLPRQLFVKMATHAATANLEEMLQLLGETIETGISPINLIEGLIDGYRETMIEKIKGTATEDTAEIVSRYDTEDFTRIIRLLSETVQKMKYSKRPSYLLEETMLYIGTMQTTMELKAILRQLPDVQFRQPEPVKVPKHTEKAQAKEAPETLVSEVETPKIDNISLFKDRLKEEIPEIADVLNCLEIVESETELLFKVAESSKEIDYSLINDGNKQKIVSLISEIFGSGFNVRFDIPEAKVENPKESENIENILELFDAKPLD